MKQHGEFPGLSVEAISGSGQRKVLQVDNSLREWGCDPMYMHRIPFLASEVDGRALGHLSTFRICATERTIGGIQQSLTKTYCINY